MTLTRSAYTRALDRFFGTLVPWWRVLVNGFLLGTIPSVVLIGLIQIVIGIQSVPEDFFNRPAASLLYSTLVFAPLVETLLLAVIVWMLRRFIRDRMMIALVVGVLAGLAHGASAAIWFFGTAWTFFVMTYVFVTWRQVSAVLAFLLCMGIHFVNNSFAMSIYLLGDAS